VVVCVAEFQLDTVRRSGREEKGERPIRRWTAEEMRGTFVFSCASKGEFEPRPPECDRGSMGERALVNSVEEKSNDRIFRLGFSKGGGAGRR